MMIEEVKELYKADVTAHGKILTLTLLPTEWERASTKITMDVTGGRVRELALSIAYKANPAARDTLFELFRTKWGEPRPALYDSKLLIFRDTQPRVSVREDPDHDAWKIEIRQ
jgi:hypothetical protein